MDVPIAANVLGTMGAVRMFSYATLSSLTQGRYVGLYK